MVPAIRRWTLAEVHRLPDDGNKYELVHGELFVTPPPSDEHETVIARLTAVLVPYVVSNGLGLVYHPRSVIRRRGSEVEPDLMVRRPPPEPYLRDSDWERVPLPLLVVEVGSGSTRRRDLGAKREFYLELGIPEYWFLDRPDRTLHVVRPGHDDRAVDDVYRWHPDGAAEGLEVRVGELYG